jgi:hypothetical protein
MWRRIIWQRSGGYWLFYCSAIYLAVGLYCAVYLKEVPTPLIQIGWLVAISLPLWCNPLARWLNMKENTMFDWMKKNKMPENVVPFPTLAPKLVEPPPAPKPEPKTYYTFGLTDNNRISFTMGYTTLTMNSAGVQQLIDQLEFFRDQLHTEE